MKTRNRVLHITNEEYSRINVGTGVITYEYTSPKTDITRSFMWNRTLRLGKRLYIEGLNMVIE